MLRELTENESNIVSGGNANSGYEGSNCTNAAIKGGVNGAMGGAVAGAIRGGVTGIGGGPGGVVAGAGAGAAEGAVYGGVPGAIGGYVGCQNSGYANNGGNSSNLGVDSSDNSVN